MINGWCVLESDPGVFTELSELMGVKGVQVEEVYTLDEPYFSNFLSNFSKVHGFIFLFNWNSDNKSEESGPVEYYTESSDLFFASQVIENACGTQALLSVFLNDSSVELSPELQRLKEFAAFLEPSSRGLAISNCDSIRFAHNSFNQKSSLDFQASEEHGDAFHFISYIPFKGKLLEIDGLKMGPVCLGDCTDNNWISMVRKVVTKRIEKIQKCGDSSEIRFNLLAVTSDTLLEIKKKISNEMTKLEQVESKIALLKECGEMLETDDNLPSDIASLERLSAMCNTEIGNLKAQETMETNKKIKWKKENIRRRHDFVPFILCILKHLARTNQLQPAYDRALAKIRSNQNPNDNAM